MTREWTEIRSRVPVWNAFQSKQEGGGDDGEADGIWELTNFERGQAFRKIFGGHLPHFYPVIACWNGSEAVSIKSMDLTAPSWSSPAAAERRVNQLVNSLAAFEGIGGEGPAPGQIISRRLILIIPGKSPGRRPSSCFNGPCRQNWQALSSISVNMASATRINRPTGPKPHPDLK